MDFRRTWAAVGKVGMITALMAIITLWATLAIAGVNEDLVSASIRGNLPEVKRLLDKGADVNAKIELGGSTGTPQLGGYTALMGASFSGNREIVALLLDKGADVNAKNDLGMTALMEAAGSGNPEVVQLLLDKGADVNAMSKTKRTALGEALMMGPYPEIRKILIKAGADPRTERAWMKYY
ncbi:MAG: ankyrin repeat domain-containing protein [Syntrophobacterales bacterium]|jgi:ankyrin repeat protein